MENGSQWRKANLFPKETTFSRLGYWEELHKINADISFPEKLIEEEKWMEVADFFVDRREELKEIGGEITEYIYSGSTYGREVEDIANGRKE